MTKTIPDKVKEKMVGAIPVGRIGTPEDIANAAAFLASEYASYITGEVLNVSGDCKFKDIHNEKNLTG